jgi:hypothetical protein
MVENLQIQDAFAPYYAGQQHPAQEQSESHARMGQEGDENAVSRAEIRARLEACRNILARAVAADSHRR